MDILLRFVWLTGPAFFGISLILLPVFYLLWRSAPGPKKPLPLMTYLLRCLGAGVPAFVAGMAAGIFVACSVENPGNLCVLTGVFGSGPLLSGLVIAGVAYAQTRNAKRNP